MIKEVPLTPKRVEEVTNKVRTTLEAGCSIAVVGWRASNHDKFTRQLPKRKVYFLGSSPKSLAEKIGLVLFTKFVNHSVIEKTKKDKPIHPIAIETGQIKAILQSCTDLLFPLHTPSTVIIEPQPQTADISKRKVAGNGDMSDEVLDYLTTPGEKYHMTEMDVFTRDFLEAARVNKIKPGYVGKKVLALLRREHSIAENHPQLEKAGWIIGEVGDGKVQIGWYKAGEKMLSNAAHPKFEPEDPVEKAKFRISKEGELLAQKAQLQSEFEARKAELEEMIKTLHADFDVKLSHVNEKLADIETAKNLLGQLEALMKKEG